MVYSILLASFITSDSIASAICVTEKCDLSLCNSIANCLDDYMDNDKSVLKECLEGLLKAVDRNIKAKLDS